MYTIYKYKLYIKKNNNKKIKYKHKNVCWIMELDQR